MRIQFCLPNILLLLQSITINSIIISILPNDKQKRRDVRESNEDRCDPGDHVIFPPRIKNKNKQTNQPKEKYRRL